ncbi:MAG: hypothetical protein QM741_14140 [Rudaea sp.]|uniref:hypothetical protein n=1 Tax=Rudaea sp. TaxID=2136325 RepID=UPI0039E451AE
MSPLRVRDQFFAVEPFACQINRIDIAGIFHAERRIGFEDQQVGAMAGRDGAQLGEFSPCG